MKKLKKGEYQIDFIVRIMYLEKDKTFKKSKMQKEVDNIKSEFNKLLKKRKYKI